MHTTPDAVLLLHEVRERELRDEVAHPTARRANRSRFQPMHIAAVSHRLHMALGGASKRLRDGGIRRTDPLRGAEAG